MQRGSIGAYLLFSLAVAGGVGYGVYVLLRERPKSAAGEDVITVHRAEPRTVTPTRTSAPPIAPPEPAPEAVDRAEQDALAPPAIDDPDQDTVLLGTPGVSGAVAPEEIERTMKRYMVRWQRCMRRARERDQLPRGELRLAFVIDGDGSVATISYRSSVEAELATCVTDVVKKLRFDKPSDGALVKVVYPMAFVPARDGSDPLAR